MSKEYNRCVICGKIGYALRESLTVCGEHMEAIDDGWTIEVKDGEYILVDLEEIDYPPAPAPRALASPAAGDVGGWMPDPFTWQLPPELVTPEVKTVLKKLQAMLEAKGNEDQQQIATLQAALAAAQEREKTLLALIDAVKDNLPPDRTHIGNAQASAAWAWNAAIAMDLIRAYQPAQQPASSAAGEGG